MNQSNLIRRCDLLPQYHKYQKEIDQSISRVLNSGIYTLGSEVNSFEIEFAAYIGSRFGIGVASGTDGLILSLKALEIGDGDEVITSTFTPIPTVSAIITTGATPVFVDVCPKTFLLDITQVKSAITDKTKAIIPVHIFGNVVDIKALKKIIPKGVSIIEDAAQAHGSRINGKKAGSMGELGVFSFYPTKNLGAYGDGGIIVTNNQALKDKIKLMRIYGMTDKDHNIMHGINSRLDELQAAVLRTKLKYLDEMNLKRNSIATSYIKKVETEIFTYQSIHENIFTNYHVLAARVNVDRGKLINYLDQYKIQTNIYYLIPQHLQKANQFLVSKKGDFPNAERLCNEIIALPLYPEIEPTKLEYIIKTINQYIED